MNDALEALRERGAHFVVADADKRPIGREWQKTRPDFAAVTEHAEAGGLIGVMPASVGCFVADVDDGGEAGVEALTRALGPPITVTRTRRDGGFHLWYRAPDGDVGNRQWKLTGAAGDIRGSKGFVVLWDPDTLADGLSLHFDAADLVDPGKLPRRLSVAGPEAVRAAPQGTRNDTLNRAAFLAAKKGELDPDTFRDAASATGLPTAEVEATLASAASAGAGAQRRPLSKDASGLSHSVASAARRNTGTTCAPSATSSGRTPASGPLRTSASRPAFASGSRPGSAPSRASRCGSGAKLGAIVCSPC